MADYYIIIFDDEYTIKKAVGVKGFPRIIDVMKYLQENVKDTDGLGESTYTLKMDIITSEQFKELQGE